MPQPDPFAMPQIAETVRLGSTSEPDLRQLKLAWAPFADPNAPSGYGVIAGKLADALRSAGAHVLKPTEFGWDAVVAVSLPAAWAVGQNTTRRDDLIWHTMFECRPIPAGWADVLNRCRLVWVPSQDSAELFRECGVTAPIMVSGYGVDTEIFHAQDRPAAEGRPMRFLAWGPGWAGRKNLLETVEAFWRADLPAHEAVLEVKVNEGFGGPQIEDGDADGAGIENIVVREGNWQRSELAEWLRTGDVLIYLSGGEGFGLQPLEAMACGVTVICADNTGMRDYLRADVALPVTCRARRLSPGYMRRFGGMFHEWQPDFEQATAHIRWCFEHRDQVAQIGQAAAAYVTGQWSWDQAGARALAQIRQHVAGW